MKVLNNIGYISASRAQTWDKCKWQAYQSIMVDGQDQYANGTKADDVSPIEEVVYLNFGTTIHETIELFWKGGKKTLTILKELYRERCVANKLSDKSYYELGFELLERYFYYLRDEAPKRKFLASELFFEYYLEDPYKKTLFSLRKLCSENDINYSKSDDKEVLIEKLKSIGAFAKAKGTIDSIWYRGNGVYEIVDYKTSNWLPTTDEVESNLQLAFYDLAFFKSEQCRSVWIDGKEPKALILTLHFLKYDNGVVSTEFSEEERELNRMYFVDTYKQMVSVDDKDIVPNLNTFCTYCSCECHMYDEVLETQEFDVGTPDTFIDNMKEIERLNSIIKILSSKVEGLKSDNIDFIKHENGSCLIDDKEYYLTNYTKRQVDFDKCYNILSKNGLWNARDFINSLAIGKVESICKQHPEVMAEIEDTAMSRYIGVPIIKSRKIPKHKLF